MLLDTIYFFFNDTATTEIYTLSLHDALPIFDHRLELLHLLAAGAEGRVVVVRGEEADRVVAPVVRQAALLQRVVVHELVDRKSTRLNSSHANISYAVFCLKKNKCIAASSVPM